MDVTDSTGASGRIVRRRRLHGLLEQPVDLGRHGGRRGVAVLGEGVAALAAARDRGQQRLVVAEPDADRRDRDAARARLGGDAREAVRVRSRRRWRGRRRAGAASRRRGRPRGAPPAGRAGGRRERFVMPPGAIAAIAARAAGLASPSGPGREHDPDGVVEGDDARACPRGARRSTSASSARRAASSRSPAIEPLRSSTTCTAAGSRGSPSRSGACSSSSTVSSSSCSTATSSTSSCAFRCIARLSSGGPASGSGRRRRDLTATAAGRSRTAGRWSGSSRWSGRSAQNAGSPSVSVARQPVQRVSARPGCQAGSSTTSSGSHTRR